jgi:hypothetical protein
VYPFQNRGQSYNGKWGQQDNNAIVKPISNRLETMCVYYPHPIGLTLLNCKSNIEVD